MSSSRATISLARSKLCVYAMILTSVFALAFFMSGFFLTKRELGLKSTCDVSHFTRPHSFCMLADKLGITVVLFKLSIKHTDVALNHRSEDLHDVNSSDA